VCDPNWRSGARLWSKTQPQRVSNMDRSAQPTPPASSAVAVLRTVAALLRGFDRCFGSHAQPRHFPGSRSRRFVAGQKSTLALSSRREKAGSGFLICTFTCNVPFCRLASGAFPHVAFVNLSGYASERRGISGPERLSPRRLVQFDLHLQVFRSARRSRPVGPRVRRSFADHSSSGQPAFQNHAVDGDRITVQSR